MTANQPPMGFAQEDATDLPLPDFEAVWALRAEYGENKVWHRQKHTRAHRAYATFGHIPAPHDLKDSSYMFAKDVGATEACIREVPACLRELHAAMNARLGVEFNQVLLNWFADGTEHIPMHKDCLVGLDVEAGVAILTLQEPTDPDASTGPRDPCRRFNIQSGSHAEGVQLYTTPVPHGSLVRLRGPALSDFKHGVPRSTSLDLVGTRAPVPRRVSVSFRRYSPLDA